MKSYRNFVGEFARLAQEARSIPPGGFRRAFAPLRPDSPKALIFSPHPDDESITGGLALRLLREARWNIVNVAVTLGSRQERRAGRLNELSQACQFLGFDLVSAAENGLENINPSTRATDPNQWSTSVAAIAAILREQRPAAIFFPHEQDWNRTHIGTHFLVLDALAQVTDLDCFLLETEFWGQMADPNLLVEYSLEDVADLVAAVSFHGEEVKRNPYHLRLPSWMHDNVRRGAELVGGQGKAAPDFVFAQLFRLRRWQGGRSESVYEGGRILPATTGAATLFQTQP